MSELARARPQLEQTTWIEQDAGPRGREDIGAGERLVSCRPGGKILRSPTIMSDPQYVDVLAAHRPHPMRFWFVADTFCVVHIKLRQVSHFLAVWRHGSFRGAAREVHLSQPALSRSIHNLEESLGVPLFDRQATEVTLTRYGEAFAPRGEALLAEAVEIKRELSLMRGLGVGRFSVAMGAHAGGISGVQAVGRLLGEHPGLQVRVESRHWRDAERLVRTRQVDIGFAEVAHLQGVADLRVESVGRHQLVICCRPGHPLLTLATPVTTEHLDGYPFVGPPIPQRLAHLLPRNARIDERTGDVFPPIVVDGISSVSSIIAATDAVGASVPISIEPLLRSGELEVVPFTAPWFRADYGFIQLASRSVSPAAVAFMDLVKAIECDVDRRNRALVEELFGSLAPENCSRHELDTGMLSPGVSAVD